MQTLVKLRHLRRAMEHRHHRGRWTYRLDRQRQQPVKETQSRFLTDRLCIDRAPCYPGSNRKPPMIHISSRTRRVAWASRGDSSRVSLLVGACRLGKHSETLYKAMIKLTVHEHSFHDASLTRTFATRRPETAMRDIIDLDSLTVQFE